MDLRHMKEADRKWLRGEMKAVVRPVLAELKEIKELLNQGKQASQKFPGEHSGSFAYTQAGITPDDVAQAARRQEATTLYDGAAVEKKKEAEDGSEEVVRPGGAC